MKRHHLSWSHSVVAVLLAATAACSSSSSSTSPNGTGGTTGGSSTSETGSTTGGTMTDAEYQQAIVTSMHDSILTDINDLLQASKDLAAAAPMPAGRGWDATQDATAIASMKEAWKRARTAYEHTEGALAPIFPDIDVSIDARYDDFLVTLAPTGDTNLFDDSGVTGMHAIERILYSDTTPANVVAFEATLLGNKVAAFPATEAEATDFKTKLCAKLVADVTTLSTQWTPQKIDLPGAFQGLVALMNEQKEKVNKASTSEEESRYSQRTMADIRDNLDGTTKIYGLFRSWLVTKGPADGGLDGTATDTAIEAGFSTLAATYATVTGDAIPTPPSTWSGEMPSAADLQTPFGQLYTSVHAAVDPAADGSIVHEMNHAAALLGYPEFEEP